MLMNAMRPDVVVSDFEPGDGTGVELLNYARAIGVTAPALLVTATPPPKRITDVLFADVIPKPFHLGTLLDAIYVLKGTVRAKARSGKHQRYVDTPEGETTASTLARIVLKKVRQ